MSADDQRAAKPVSEHEHTLSDMASGHDKWANEGHQDAAGWALDQLARLGAELAETRAKVGEQRAALHRRGVELDRHQIAGDALAEGVRRLLAARGGPTAALAYSRLDGLDGVWRSVRGDAPAEPPAVELPVTLSSVDDVAAVAVSYGLELRAGPLPTWDDPQGRVRVVVEKDGWRIGMRVIVHGHDGDRFIATGPRIALAPVQAAIEAARGGSR